MSIRKKLRSSESGTEVKGTSIDAGRVEMEKYEPTAEVKKEFIDAAQLGSEPLAELIHDIRGTHSHLSDILAGDVDADAHGEVGEELVGGENPTPDQDIVEKIGEAVGLTYRDNEPLRPNEKIEARDRHRWELNPASSEGFKERMKHEGEFEEK